MKPIYYFLAAITLALLAWPQQAAAQDFTECPTDQDECVVEWATDTGEPIINALFNTVANDTARTEGRIYVLKRGGFYYNEEHVSNSGFNLRIVGQTAEEGAASGENVCGAGGDEDCGPAIIQRFQREDGSVDGLMIESSGDGDGGLTLKNLWLIGQDNTGGGQYEPIVINSSNSRFIFDNVIFDRNTWHHLGFKQSGNDIFITNSLFRNLTDGTQIWSGRAIRLEGGADTLAFENNTFMNLTSFPFQSEAEPVEYFLFNHNTLVNFGRNFNAGNIWKRAYVANNLLVNPFWQGESPEQYDGRMQTWVDQGNDPADLDPFIGIFSIGVLPSRFGLEVDRRIALVNNSWWRDPAIEAFYTPLGVRAQPLVSDSTASFFNLYAGMMSQGNLNEQPLFGNAPLTPEVYAQMETFVSQWVNGEATPWELLYWDPGRPANPLATTWPVPEDFSYTNANLMDAGTDGLPLGDLNWFPTAKDNYLANRDAYVQAIEDLAGGAPEPTIAAPSAEGEVGSLSGDATAQSVEAFTSYTFESSGFIQWDFELSAETQVDLNVWTHMQGNGIRGQRVIVNGVSLHDCFGYGEYIWDTAYDPASDPCENPHVGMPLDEWAWTLIIQDEIQEENALTLPAGANTIRIEPSWGFQAFAGIDVREAGTENVLVELRAPDATAVGPAATCQTEPGGEDLAFCPSGFQWAALSAGDGVSWAVDLPANTMSVLPQFFYVAPSGGTAELLVDGEKVADVTFPATAVDEVTQLLGSRFNVEGGMRTITLTLSTGGIDLDYVIFNAYEGIATGVEQDELPEGYALHQNYPNPFNPTTTISFTMGNPGNVRLTVYDLMGRKIATLIEGTMPVGTFHVTWDAAASSGLASGVYFYRLETPVGQQVRSMVLLK